MAELLLLLAAAAGPGALVPEPGYQRAATQAQSDRVVLLQFQGPKQAGMRLMGGTLRAPPGLLKADLLDPTGRLRWTAEGAALKTVPAAQSAQPLLGDTVLLPPLPVDAAGLWQLRLQFVQPVRPQALQFVVGLQARHQLGLPALQQSPKVGVPWPLLVLPSRDGQGVEVPEGLEVEVIGPEGQQVATGRARSGERNAHGIPISQEAAQHFFSIVFEQPGRYTRVARWRPAPGEPLLEARAAVQVER